MKHCLSLQTETSRAKLIKRLRLRGDPSRKCEEFIAIDQDTDIDDKQKQPEKSLFDEEDGVEEVSYFVLFLLSLYIIQTHALIC